MNSLRNLVCRLQSDEQGVTAMEYAMIGASTIIAIAGLLTSLSGKLSSIFAAIPASL